MGNMDAFLAACFVAAAFHTPNLVDKVQARRFAGERFDPLVEERERIAAVVSLPGGPKWHGIDALLCLRVDGHVGHEHDVHAHGDVAAIPQDRLDGGDDLVRVFREARDANVQHL